MTYSGSGYTSDPAFQVQDYLTSRWGPDGVPEGTLTVTNAIKAILSNYGAYSPPLDTFFAQYGQENYLPQTIDEFVKAIIDFYHLPPGAGTIKILIENAVGASLSIENKDLDKNTIAAALKDPSLKPYASTFYRDLYDAAFNQFLREFPYTGASIQSETLPTQDTTTDVTTLNTDYFGARFDDFFVKFASVVNTPLPTSDLNFLQVYQGYFGSADPEQFTAFLANYIQENLYNSGSSGSFLPNDIGKWMQDVQDAYATALHGSAAPTTSSVGNSFKKVVIINTLLQLLIKMIGTLQRVGAMQSDQMRILTNQQNAYTKLLTQVPVFTEGDGTIFGGKLASKEEMQNARDQANNFDQALSETIRSRRTTVQDDAQVMNSNINQSSDSANDQASTITTILQLISSIISAIYR